jgi:hypothetical protein
MYVSLQSHRFDEYDFEQRYAVKFVSNWGGATDTYKKNKNNFVMIPYHVLMYFVGTKAL